MSFRDLDEFLSVEPLELPIRGKTYSFPGEVSGRAWILLKKIQHEYSRAERAKALGKEYEPDLEVLSDQEEATLRDELFRGRDEEMAADGLTSAHLERTFMTLIAFYVAGREAAEAVWSGQGEAPAPNREARRKAKSTPSRGSRAGSTATSQAKPTESGASS